MAVFSRNKFAGSSLILGLLIVSALYATSPVLGADPDIVTDFAINVTSGADLRFTGFRDLPEAPAGTLKITYGLAAQFPAVQGMGLGPSYLSFGADSINPFHSHPRANEIFYMQDGEVEAGVMSTANKLYTATLKKGDVFVFPKGLMHYQINRSKTKTASALAIFNSQSPGRDSIPTAIFNSDPRIDTDVIVKSLYLDDATVESLQELQFPTFAAYNASKST